MAQLKILQVKRKIQSKVFEIPLEIGKLKKTLDVGLFVGSNVPKLITSLVTSSKDLLTFAKANDMIQRVQG